MQIRIKLTYIGLPLTNKHCNKHCLALTKTTKRQRIKEFSLFVFQCFSLNTLRAESPSIFLEKSGRGRRLLAACTFFDPLILQTNGWVSPVSNRSYRFSTGAHAQSYESLTFLSPRHIVYDRSTNMAAASLSYKVFEKAVKCAMTKVKIGHISSLTEPQSRFLFNFLRDNDTFVSLPTGHGKSLIYQICPAVARELVSTENQFPSESVVVVISPLISLIADLGSKPTNQNKGKFPERSVPFLQRCRIFKFCCKTIVCILTCHWSINQKSRFLLFSINFVIG